MARRILTVAALVLCLTSVSAAASEPIRSEQNVSRVLIEMRWASSPAEIRKLADDDGTACPERDKPCLGFARLGQLDNGLWICLITAVKPKNWDSNSAFVAIGHELMHCNGYQH